MACSCDNIHLLLLCQINELNSITGYTDREVRILRLLRMIHSVDQLLCAEYIDIQMMRSAVEVSVHNIYQSILLLVNIVAESCRADGLCVGNTVEGVLIWNLRDRVQGSKKAFLLGAVGRVAARRKRFISFTAVRRSACSLAVDNIGRDRKD